MDGVFSAISEHVKCQQPFTSSILQGQENCLRVNVYTPIGHLPGPLPVMVFIHGGGFFEGSGNPAIYGPEYLVTKGVILVTVNYRLNIQGFLCLRTKDAPGNVGLKDQVAALKWVQENIEHFGGKPDDVTIFGESAGAASVSFHILSTMSTGLFHKAILQSGSSLASWALQVDPIESASTLAKVLNYESTDPQELYNFFSNKSDSDLILIKAPRKKGNIIIPELLFKPCVEEEIDGVEPFLKENPYDLLSRGQFNKVPIMIGYNSEEGYLLANLEKEDLIKEITFKDSIPDLFDFGNETEKAKFADELHKSYLNKEEISQKTFQKFAKMYGDPHFDLPVSIETELQLKHNKNKIFNYKFCYDGYLNVAKRSTAFKDQTGATHADELFYMFKPSIFFTPARLLEKKMVERMTLLWTNFAKFGYVPALSLLISFASATFSQTSTHEGTKVSDSKY